MELGNKIVRIFTPTYKLKSSGKRPNDWLQFEIVSLDTLVKLLRENRLHMDPVNRAREEYGKLLALVNKGLVQCDGQTL